MGCRALEGLYVFKKNIRLQLIEFSPFTLHTCHVLLFGNPIKLQSILWYVLCFFLT